MTHIARRFVLLLSLAALVGCQSPSGDDTRADDTSTELAGATQAAVCHDEDGDGFGVGCDQGEDCNDDDDTVADECSCTQPSEGCGCEEDAEPVQCELTDADFHGDTELCKTGMRYCRDGQWTGCIGVAIFSE